MAENFLNLLKNINLHVSFRISLNVRWYKCKDALRPLLLAVGNLKQELLWVPAGAKGVWTFASCSVGSGKAPDNQDVLRLALSCTLS